MHRRPVKLVTNNMNAQSRFQYYNYALIVVQT